MRNNRKASDAHHSGQRMEAMVDVTYGCHRLADACRDEQSDADLTGARRQLGSKWRVASEYANGHFGWVLSAMFASSGGHIAAGTGSVTGCRGPVVRLGRVRADLSG
jgi:hypothetical protein